MSEDKHSWDRVPALDGDNRQWKRFMRDVELYLETEKLVADSSHGARLLSRLTGSARKHAETIELDKVRRSKGEKEDTREGMITGVKQQLKSLERAMGEWSRSSCARNSEDVQDMKAEGLNVELKSMGWHLVEKSI